MNVVETVDLGVRYSSTWALRECTVSIPKGRIVALVGSNGAGKTTLLHCLVGLVPPTSGVVEVLGSFPPGSPEALEGIAFVAQEAPLYRHVSVRAMVEIAANLNQTFDGDLAFARLEELGIPLRRKVGKLSGGQQAQLALTLALARHPELIILDEPLARLDPVARHDVMAAVLTEVAEEGLSVIFSSHVVSELERVADYLILMAHGRVQLIGEIEEILGQHVVVEGPNDGAADVAERCTVISMESTSRRTQLLVTDAEAVDLPDGWEGSTVSLDELVLAYLRDSGVGAPPRLRAFTARGAGR